MFGIEIGFYFLGFATAVTLIAIITEVNDRSKKNKKELRATYRKELKRQEQEQEELLNDIKDSINIDVRIY